MKEPSAHWAKNAKPERRRTVAPSVVYTVGGEKLTFQQVCEAVRAANPDCQVSDRTIRARLDRGRRDVKDLGADALPQYRPMGLRRKP